MPSGCLGVRDEGVGVVEGLGLRNLMVETGLWRGVGTILDTLGRRQGRNGPRGLQGRAGRVWRAPWGGSRRCLLRRRPWLCRGGGSGR